MSYNYFVLTLSKDGKFYSYSETISSNQNLFSIFKGIPRLESVFCFKTNKEAKQTADCWNKQYKENGTLLF